MIWVNEEYRAARNLIEETLQVISRLGLADRDSRAEAQAEWDQVYGVLAMRLYEWDCQRLADLRERRAKRIVAAA